MRDSSSRSVQYAATVQASLRRSARGSMAEAHSGLSRKMVQSAGRSTHDESMFHLVERIPEGTERNAECPWTTPIPKEEQETESVSLPAGPIGLWRSVMITSYDLMLVEFTSDGTSWTITQRSKHYSVSRMFLREKPQVVGFMIFVTRGVIKVSREVTDATLLMCAAQAPLEMVLSKPLKPTAQHAKKPLIDEAVKKTHDVRAKVDEIDKNRSHEAYNAQVNVVDMTNAEIFESKDDKGEIAKGTESKVDDVAKIECVMPDHCQNESSKMWRHRIQSCTSPLPHLPSTHTPPPPLDRPTTIEPKSTRSTRRTLRSSSQKTTRATRWRKVPKSQIDDVAKIERDKASEAETDAVAENKNGEVHQECDSKSDVEQATEAPQQRQPQQLSSATVGAPDRDAAQYVQQRTVEQVVDVPDDAGTEAPQRTVEPVVEAVDETTATNPLDREPLDETQRVERSAVRAKAAAREGSLSRAVRLELERVRYEQAAQRRYKRARARSSNTLLQYLPYTQHQHQWTCMGQGWCPVRMRCHFYSYLSEPEKQCIDKSETCTERKFRREAEIAGLNEAPSILSGGESSIASALSCVRTGTTRVRIFWWADYSIHHLLVDLKSNKKFLRRHSSTMAYHRIPALTDLRLHLR